MSSSAQHLAIRALLILLVSLLSAQGHASRLAVQVSDSAGQPLSEAVVVARPVSVGAMPVASSAEMPVTVDMMVQQDQSFNPAVMVVSIGARVGFPNRDRMRHHIYSFSEAKRFEVRLYSGDDVPTVIFDKPGIVTLGCNIHDWMSGFIYVADSPYFAVSDRSGGATITELPHTSYELVLWHPTLGETQVVLPGLVRVAGDVQLAATLPATSTLAAQVPGDEDPLTAKFRRRPR